LLLEVGDYVNTDDVVVVMESDKGEAEVRTTASGVITEFKFNIGDDAGVGSIMFLVDTTAAKGQAKPAEAAKEAKADKTEKPAPKAAKKEEVAPVAKKADPAPKAEKKADAAPAPKTTSASKVGDGESFVAPAFERAESREKMSRMRKTIARRLKDSQNTYASISTFNEVINIKK
jgi:2-oxoglutarate dehydrogenase E2 component (dihydrolipoamide succinyltransferase)